MIIWLIKYLLYKYLYLYLLFLIVSPVVILAFCSFVFNHVDKRYLRENGRLCGLEFSYVCDKIYMLKYFISQVNNINEFITGFTDGMLKKQQCFILKIKEIEKPVIVEKEIIKEVEKPIVVEKEVIKEVEKIVYVEISKEDKNIIPIDCIDVNIRQKDEPIKSNDDKHKKEPKKVKKHEDNNLVNIESTKNIGTNVFDLFEKTDNTGSKLKVDDVFIEDSKNDEKTIQEIKNKTLLTGGKKLNIKIIPKQKNKKK